METVRRHLNSLDCYNGCVTIPPGRQAPVVPEQCRLLVMRSLSITASCIAVSAMFCGAAAAQDGPKLASVQVDGCSGTFVAQGPKWAYGLSVAHCAAIGDNVAVIFGDGNEASGVWLDVDPVSDLALFRIQAHKSVALVELAPVSDGIVGWGRNGLKKLKYSETGRVYDKNKKSSYTRAEFVVVGGVFDNGDSGGGVFSKGRLCGVISHGHKDNLYASTHSQVLSFLGKQKELKHKLVAEAGSWGDKDRTREILALKEEIANLKASINKIKSVPKAQPGLQGEAGADGKDGADGQPGIDGEPGAPGKPGADGSSELNSAGMARIEKIEAWIRNFRATVRVRLVPTKE